MNSSVFTVTYDGVPAQLIGILWQDGDTGLAVVRLRNEGHYLRTVHPSKLKPIPPKNLRLTSPPRSEDSNGPTQG